MADGYTASNVLGCDLRQEFIDCGYELYQDESTCGIRFFPSDIFEVPYPAPIEAVTVELGRVEQLKQLVGRLDTATLAPSSTCSTSAHSTRWPCVSQCS